MKDGGLAAVGQRMARMEQLFRHKHVLVRQHGPVKAADGERGLPPVRGADVGDQERAHAERRDVCCRNDAAFCGIAVGAHGPLKGPRIRPGDLPGADGRDARVGKRREQLLDEPVVYGQRVLRHEEHDVASSLAQRPVARAAMIEFAPLDGAHAHALHGRGELRRAILRGGIDDEDLLRRDGLRLYGRKQTRDSRRAVAGGDDQRNAHDAPPSARASGCFLSHVQSSIS